MNGITTAASPANDTTDHAAASGCIRVTVGQQIEALIRDARPIAHDVFDNLSPEQLRAVAFDAWNIGLTALANAFTQSREARLDEIGHRLLDDVRAQLDAFAATQCERMSTSLAGYFDPKSGEFSKRVAGFIADDGELQRALVRHVGASGTLAQTLAQHIGENSPLLRRLSPTESDGLIKVLEERVSAVLAAEHGAFVKALDPLAPDGAVSRFLVTLRNELRKTDEDRVKQLATATSALDANNPQSLINRLLRQSQQTSQALLHAVNPDAAGSAMSAVRATLVATLQAHFKESSDRLDAQEKRQVLFQQQVTAAIARMEGARERDRKSTRGGFEFQDEVLLFIQRALANGPYVAEKTANTVGLRKNCKVGDQVVRFTNESAFYGAVLVVEAKREAHYTLANAQEELTVARANRGATGGLFVIAASHAPPDFPLFTRHGEDVFVVWDPEDEISDSYFHAAILLALCLASRRVRPPETGRIDALARLEGRLEAERRRLETMKKCNEKIREGSEKLAEEIEKGLSQFKILIRKGKETLAALNVSSEDTGDESGLSFERLAAANDDYLDEISTSESDDEMFRSDAGDPPFSDEYEEAEGECDDEPDDAL
jgi:hypothetical protein